MTVALVTKNESCKRCAYLRTFFPDQVCNDHLRERRLKGIPTAQLMVEVGAAVIGVSAIAYGLALVAVRLIGESAR